MDTIITQEGRAQIGTGKLVSEYVSFSDMGAIYKLDTIISGGLDVIDRLCFEATNLPQDLITLEADDSGRLIGNFVSGSDQYQVSTGQIFSGSAIVNRAIVSSSQFTSLSEHLLKSSINNFKKLYNIGSPDVLNENFDQFIISPTRPIKFVITDDKPLSSETDIQEISIDSVESLFFDKRLSHIPNFKYLPPINKTKLGERSGKRLGNYVHVGQRPYLTYKDVLSEVKELKRSGFEETICFTETSRENNLFCQLFEVSGNEMIKLDVIDFGSFPAGSDGISRHIFFAGKIFEDSTGSTTYVHIFSIIFNS